MALRNLTFSTGRLIQVGAPLLLGLLGCVLTYYSVTSLNAQIEPERHTVRLFGGAALARSLEPQDLPVFYTAAFADGSGSVMGPWLDLFSVGVTLHEVGVVVGAVTVVSLLMNEIHKLLFWGLHLAGWLLVMATVAMWFGVIELRGFGVDLDLGPAWIPLTLAGIALIVLTLRARSRIDTYAGV